MVNINMVIHYLNKYNQFIADNVGKTEVDYSYWMNDEFRVRCVYLFENNAVYYNEKESFEEDSGILKDIVLEYIKNRILNIYPYEDITDTDTDTDIEILSESKIRRLYNKYNDFINKAVEELSVDLMNHNHRTKVLPYYVIKYLEGMDDYYLNCHTYVSILLYSNNWNLSNISNISVLVSEASKLAIYQDIVDALQNL